MRRLHLLPNGAAWGLLALAAVLACTRCTRSAPAPVKQDPPWHLEFRILANNVDEKQALEAAQKYFKEEGRKKELEKLAREGKPPAPLKLKTDKAPGYTWVEVGPAELSSLKLDNAEEKAAEGNEAWKQAAEARKKGEASNPYYARECLLYSRRCENRRLTREERAKKKYDYFLLTRDPEKGREMTGKYLSEVKVGTGQEKERVVNFAFNKKGSELFFELTSKNRPVSREGFHRNLAVILDGQIIMAPRLVSPIRDKGIITGRFTATEIEAIAKVLRSDMARAKK